MKTKIENKIKFLESIIAEMRKDYENLEYTSIQIEQDYSIEELIYTSKIKVLKQLLTENKE